ncbi:hypothetical protein GCM10011297_02670 [Bacterioplanes sanyensis]|uniref:PilZ domain-containing protein n=1 Tax=Bacterioplanes sanyensis TaxID=1249553 RepID=UPI00167331CD|nr:PilZ domain-containing protein [Bacterioplanes sanyensis]GGY33179.1 hypothetical protein GCM10011297_02670 [Bacterioplanes sanyensis]
MTERRFQQRHSAAPLKLTLRRQYWLGLQGRESEAIGRDFSRSGIAVFSQQRWRPGSLVLINLESSDHRLAAVPAELLRCEANGSEYVCALRFRLDHLSDNARQAVDTVLQRLQHTLDSAA